MKIYTKTGDQGETGLFGGARVPKDHLRIQTYGVLDELNACLGLMIAEPGVPSALQEEWTRLQAELFQLGTELATPAGKNSGIDLIEAPQIQALERAIDRMEEGLPPLKNFILPGGSRLAALTHLARTVSRRAERALVSLLHVEPLRPEVLEYLNRLSDYLFVAARFANHVLGHPDTPWIAPRKSERK
jgi:cob(I)alamin adenosyltransferase